MAYFLVPNNASATLANSVDIGGTSIEIESISDELSTALGLVSSTKNLLLTIFNSDESAHEIIQVTAWDSGTSTLTCTRAAGGTSEQEWARGTQIEARVNSALLDGLTDDAADYTIALPRGDGSATHEGAVVLGHNASGTNSAAIAIGESSESSGNGSVGIGPWAIASDSQAIALGYDADGLGNQSIAVGNGAEVLSGANSGIAIGGSSSCAENVSYGIAIGSGSAANADYAVILGGGSGAVAGAEDTIVIGAFATGNGLDSVVIGRGAQNDSNGNSVAVGHGAENAANYSMALGKDSLAQIKAGLHLAAVSYHPNTAAAPTLETNDIMTRHRAASQMTLATAILDLTDDTDYYDIEIPAGAHFYPDHIDIIIASASSTGGTPEISVGTSDTETNSILAASTISKTAAYGRHSFTADSLDGVTNITVHVATAGTGTWTCRAVVVGYLVEDE